MTVVDWNKFRELSGADTANFEILCRTLVRRHYAKYGTFYACANQPGVEFYIHFTEACSLAMAGEWFGWQCRWYDLDSGRSIGTTRKNKIKKSIEKSIEVIPNITDWVLWTRNPLTARDQNWFYNLDYNIKLHLWDENEIRGHLTGEAEILYLSYFGKLILTPEILSKLHERSVAPIRNRWIPNAHQIVNAERELRKVLGEEHSWCKLAELVSQLKSDIKDIRISSNNLRGELKQAINEIISSAEKCSNEIKKVKEQLRYGEFDSIWQDNFKLKIKAERQLAKVQHVLRAKGHPASLVISNTLIDINKVNDLFKELCVYLKKNIIVVVADAGCGKTQLSAQLTRQTDNKPAGIFISGRDLNSRQCLDDLARRILINGSPIESMEALIAAVDSAGQRSHCRIPIVIDGLNEAEDPRDWKYQLEQVSTILKDYPWVVLICTIRSEFENISLPSTIAKLDIPDFQEDAIEAINRYFECYKIDIADTELVLDLLRHPLTLRLFCEVINPERKDAIKIEGMISSLTDLFEKYLEQIYERITELSPKTSRYYEQDVRSALTKIGLILWDKKARALNTNYLRKQLKDEERLWNESLVRAFEQEGILIQYPASYPDQKVATIVFDALAGHIIAKSLLSMMGKDDFEEWINTTSVISLFTGSLSEQHPLARDIFRALVGLVPRRYSSKQLWQLSKGPIRDMAIFRTVYLDGKYLDAESIAEIKKLIISEPKIERDLFERLMETRGIVKHPLNADFLDRLLSDMSTSERDLRWTEWTRFKKDKIVNDLKRLEIQWREKNDIGTHDLLRAKWVMWLLTSTSREIRDQATYTLYWFGRIDAAKVFELAIISLSLNDPYVTERMFAVCYGIAMAKQFPDSKYLESLEVYLVKLRDNLVGSHAYNPTNHYLIRLYVQGIVELALTFYSSVIPDGLLNKNKVVFAGAKEIAKISRGDENWEEIHSILDMDFENYTMGRLFEDRYNYQEDHKGHQDSISYVLGTAWAFGWRNETFVKIEESIQKHQYFSRNSKAKTERYGKKYSWIGFYFYAGILYDEGKLPRDGERISDLGIDPSFPEKPPVLPKLDSLDLIQTTLKDNNLWIVNGNTSVPDELLYRKEIYDIEGPWIAVKAYLKIRHFDLWRSVFGFVECLLVDENYIDELISAFRNVKVPEIWKMHRDIGEFYTFAGEIPWSAEFGKIAFEGRPNDFYKRVANEGLNHKIIVEKMSHTFSWERHHCHLNNTGEVIIPSKSVSKYFKLRGKPQTFNQYEDENIISTISLSAPDGYSGFILYIREDIVYKYSKGRKIVWHCWGERQLDDKFEDLDPEVKYAMQRYKNIWRYDKKGEELSDKFKN